MSAYCFRVAHGHPSCLDARLVPLCGDCSFTFTIVVNRLASNIAMAAFGERAFNLGRFAGMYEADDWHRPQPWLPGRGLSADHECKDCGAPLRTDDAAQGFRTCDRCAAERRAMR
jgi:hypothetical protein